MPWSSPLPRFGGTTGSSVLEVGFTGSVVRAFERNLGRHELLPGLGAPPWPLLAAFGVPTVMCHMFDLQYIFAFAVQEPGKNTTYIFRY